MQQLTVAEVTVEAAAFPEQAPFASAFHVTCGSVLVVVEDDVLDELLLVDVEDEVLDELVLVEVDVDVVV